MGRFKESDGGMTAARIHPCNYWQNSCDHAVTFRFTPIGPQKTLQEVCWLVHPDAVAGRDYRVEDLTWMWKATTDEDKRIIDYNQRGVNSSAYVPGPYATIENGVNTFVNWYLAQL
jgi:Rieske 2Fe-2S family protein